MSIVVSFFLAALGVFICLGNAASQEKIARSVRSDAERSGAKVMIVFRKANVEGIATFASQQPRSYLLQSLSGSDARALSQIPGLPIAVGEIGVDAIARLEADQNVLAVVKDEPMAVMLHESAGLIGAPAVWAHGNRGSGQTVAVVDSGVDETHPGLSGKVVGEACFSTAVSTIYSLASLCPQQLELAIKKGAATPCNQAIFGCDHGTHVAGIIASREFVGNGHTIRGLADEAKIYAIQVFTLFNDSNVCGAPEPCIRTFPSDQIRALAHVLRIADDHSIIAVNASIGAGNFPRSCDADNPSYTEAIQRLHDKRIPVIAASGNEAFPDGVAHPACIARAVAVTATDKANNVAVQFANISRDVDLAAPGASILSTVTGGSAAKNGTSMAAPHVSAAWAILKSIKPDASVDEILTVLQSTGREVKDIRTDTRVRLINIEKAVEALTSLPPLSSATPTVDQPAMQATSARANRIIVVPERADPLASMSPLEIEQKLRDITQGQASARRTGTAPESPIIIESPSGVSRDELMKLVGPKTRVFEDAPQKPQNLKQLQ